MVDMKKLGFSLNLKMLGHIISSVFLRFIGRFGLQHYTPSPKAASYRVISPELASYAQSILRVALVVE